MTTNARDNCIKYIRAIRNEQKKQYGFSLLFSWDNRNNIPRNDISPMAAQAVMLRLSEIIKATDNKLPKEQ